MRFGKWVRGGVVALAIAVVGGAGAVLAEDGGSASDKQPTVEDLAWLEGTWVEADEHSVFEEIWMAPSAGAAVAVSRWVENGAIKLYELSAIETDADGTWLRLRHFGRGLAPWKSEADGPAAWKLVRTAERRAEFEDPGRGFPQRVVYHRVADDRMQVALEGLGADAHKRMPFEFRRR